MFILFSLQDVLMVINLGEDGTFNLKGPAPIHPKLPKMLVLFFSSKEQMHQSCAKPDTSQSERKKCPFGWLFLSSTLPITQQSFPNIFQ